jgi:pyruvate,water dikinase
VSEVKGIVASKGKSGSVRGTARIVSDPHNTKGFNEGDILVASMTSPEYIYLMRKSSAIITDEGGLTSHAAIVSRELGVPCIVGTKVATKVLHDGDYVEVDANRGVVAVLKKH